MNENGDVRNLCLEAFGAVSAMVSHDLKNCLAIINENAGLLDDLAVMAEGSGGVASPRVRTAAAKIAMQVARSNAIIKNLNRFAHSGDIPMARAGVGEMLELMVALTVRRAAARSIAVSVVYDGNQQVETSLLHLQVLIYLLLVHFYSNAAAGSTVVLKASREAGNLVLCCEATFAEGVVEPSPGERVQPLLAHLGGSYRCSGNTVVLTLPGVMAAGGSG